MAQAPGVSCEPKRQHLAFLVTFIAKFFSKTCVSRRSNAHHDYGHGQYKQRDEFIIKKKHFSEGPTPLPLGFNIIFLLSVVLLRNLSLSYKTKSHIFILEQKPPLNMAEVIHLPLLTFFSQRKIHLKKCVHRSHSSTINSWQTKNRWLGSNRKLRVLTLVVK